jgi:diacylglycerol kinase (ATP)
MIAPRLSTARSIRVLVNPSAGRGRGAARLDHLRILASAAGAGFVMSRSATDVIEQARRAAVDGVERFLVAGGDGTAHYAVQGLAGTPCALAMIPLGTGNDLAAALGAPRRLEEAWAAALSRPVRSIDLLRVGDTYAVGYAGVGFDSEVTRVANRVRRLRGPLVYAYAVLRTLASFVPPRMRLVHDHATFEGRVMFAVVANLPSFGGGMKIAPEARIDDGLLDLVLVREIPRRTLLAVFPKVYSGRHVGHPAIVMARVRKAEITIDRPLDLYGGGEPLRTMVPGEPVTIEVVSGALRAVCV